MTGTPTATEIQAARVGWTVEEEAEVEALVAAELGWDWHTRAAAQRERQRRRPRRWAGAVRERTAVEAIDDGFRLLAAATAEKPGGKGVLGY